MHFENMTEYHEGKDVLLAFKSDTGEALTSAASIDYDREGYILGEAAKIIKGISLVISMKSLKANSVQVVKKHLYQNLSKPYSQ